MSHPIKKEVTDHADFSGRTAAVESVEVRARVGGYLDDVHFKEGAIVSKGQLLFEIDPRPYQAALNLAKAQVAANEALLKKAKADNVRNRTLSTKLPGTITQQDLDQYQAAEDQALANVHIAESTLETNRLNLEFTRVTSPIDGRISRFNVTKGNLVTLDQTLLTTIISLNPLYAYFDVDERTVLNVTKMISEGKAKSARDTTVHVTMGLANETGFPHAGTINFVDNQVNPRTGTLRLRGTFSNDDKRLTPGLFVRVRVPIGEPHSALLITDRALDTDQGQKIVYVVDADNKVDSRPVQVGDLHDGLRVITSGLNTGDRVIVNGLQRVRPGVTVDPKLVDMPVYRDGHAEGQPSTAPTRAQPNTSS